MLRGCSVVTAEGCVLQSMEDVRIGTRFYGFLKYLFQKENYKSTTQDSTASSDQVGQEIRILLPEMMGEDARETIVRPREGSSKEWSTSSLISDNRGTWKIYGYFTQSLLPQPRRWGLGKTLGPCL